MGLARLLLVLNSMCRKLSLCVHIDLCACEGIVTRNGFTGRLASTSAEHEAKLCACSLPAMSSLAGWFNDK